MRATRNKCYWPDCWSQSGRLPWHQWQQLFLSTSFVEARPPNPLPPRQWSGTGCPFSYSVSSALWLACAALLLSRYCGLDAPALLYCTVAAFWLNPPVVSTSVTTWPPSALPGWNPLSWAFDTALISISCRALLLLHFFPGLCACLYHDSFFLLLLSLCFLTLCLVVSVSPIAALTVYHPFPPLSALVMVNVPAIVHFFWNLTCLLKKNCSEKREREIVFSHDDSLPSSGHTLLIWTGGLVGSVNW